jgi:hypothetical protein
MAAGISTVQGDFTCFGVFALCPHNELVVLDWFHGRIDGTRQIPTLKAYWSRHRAERIGVEAVAYQWTYRKVSGAPARARDYDALQSSPSRHVLAPPSFQSRNARMRITAVKAAFESRP